MSKHEKLNENMNEKLNRLDDDALEKVSGGVSDPSDPGKPGEEEWSDGYSGVKDGANINVMRFQS